MSRIIQQIATVQFQVDNRKVTASMNALQTEAESLNGKIAAVKQSIKSLGDVPTDNKFLLDYQKQLRQLNSDLKDVTTAQRDLMKGVKAADQLWKAAATQDIESLSIKAIKAGQNGLRKRMDNLRPELGGDDAKMYDAYKAVIEEADRVIKVFQADATSVVQTIRDGGVVSEQVMKRTRDALKDMIEAEKEGTAEQRQLTQQYDFLNESLANVAEMRRREKGEIVNANDARREALKLTEEGIAAARYERDMADTVIASMQQKKNDLDQLRRFHEDRIAQIEREIATNQRLEEAEQDRIADVEKAMRYNENEDQKSAIRLRKKADATKEEAELLDAIARRNEAVGESQAKIDRSRQRANEKLAEYISLNQKAEQMEEKVAHQEERHAEAMDHQSERLRQIRAEGQRLLDQYEQQKSEIQAVDKAWADADVKQGEAEARKAQNQELTTKSIEDSICKLKEANAVIDTNSDEWEENTRIIQRLQQAQDEISQKQKEMMGEWMSYAEAEKFAAQAGTEGFIATGQQMQQAQQALERRRDALIKSIQVRRQEKNMTNEQKEALAAEEAQLEKVNAELKKMKFEMDNTNMSAKRMKDILDNPSTAKNIEELGQAVKRAQAQLKMMEDTVGKTNKKYQEMAQKTKEAAQRQKELEVQFKASASAFDKAWSRLKTYVGLYVGASVAMNKLMGTVGDIQELSDKMGEVRKTTGFTADEVGRLSNNLKQLDTRTGLTSLMETAAKAGQLGLKSLEDVQGFTQAANMLMVALPEMGQEAATEMLKVALATGEVKKIQDQINKGLIEGSSATEVAMTKIGSTIDQLRANSAAAAPQITDFVKRVGAVGAQSGISIDQVAALGATVDALGMRVEMSATALSRMIPAIKNNAFELAKAIGVTPETVRNLFDTGRGMEVILTIFDRIKESGMDADSIENMLGMAGMKDIMKDLNQQGARAGIVFAGLSQNVDELRRNLHTAGEAYEENIAILSEYNKMNDTTAAKWERLKNQVEEFFVGDTAQRWFGYIITGMRWFVDLLTSGNGISAGLRIIIVYLGLVKANIGGILVGIKNCGGGLKGIAMWLGIIDKQTKKLAWGNIFTALAMAAIYAWHELSNLKTALEKANEALGKTKEEVDRAQMRFEGYYQKLKSTSEALQQARISHDKLSAEVDKLRQSTDKSTTATDNLKKKEDELKKSEDKVTQASREHKSAISDMNSIYGKYLGFILTEANYSNLAAAAHDKVTAAIEREMLMKQRQAAIGDVDSQYAQDIATGYGKLNEKLVSYGKLDRREASQAMSDLQKFLHDNVKYDSGSNQSVVSKAVTDQLKREGLDLSKATADEVVALWYDKYLKENYHISDNVRRGITGVERRDNVDKGWGSVYTPFSTNLRGGYASTYVQREQQRGAVSTVYDTDITRSEGEEAKAAGTLLSKLEQQAKQAKKSILDKNTNNKDRNVAYGELANALEGLENRINELNPQRDAETINRLRDMAKSLSSSGIDVKKLKKAREEIHATLFERATFNEDTIKNLDTTNPWGSALEAESTDWKNMTAEQLVNRRKQMKDFVNAIQTDTDVQSVLKEDAALRKAIEKGMSSDMRTVIEWYNTERLKIQDELHARHLTNTGDWMDPKKERGARKQFRDEMDAYLHELDAYYTERKTRIEEAGTDEGLTEAEIRNRTLNNEMEWQQRRAELQKLYSRKQKEVTQEELDVIYHIIAERTGDSETFVKAQIAKTNQFVDSIEKSGEKGAAIVHRWMSQMELDTERSYLKGQQALTKQMRAIEAIIDKERPFNGITKSLQESLSTMDILTGEMRKEYNELMKQGKDMTDFNNRQAQEEMKRTAFLLGEAENAYSTTIDRVMDNMRNQGMTAWADWLSADPKLQEALMAQLRSTYDAIQDAIKKEASQLKKQAEIMWNNILMPDGKTTLKQQTDRIVAQLGIDEGRVKRANSLIGAGQDSERVADKLAIQQMKVELAMREHYYNLMKKQGLAHVEMLKAQAKAAKERGDEEEATRKTLDAQHAQMSLNLATSKEETELAKQREDIIARTEESQNRLYTELRSWVDLFTSSLQSVFEASHAGDAEYYNERAKLNLTGKGGPGAGTYVVIENEGTEDAVAHYEYLDEREALERQREIENDNAVAEAWEKVMNDINMKMDETITDQLNAMLQDASIDANTQAVIANTEALYATSGKTGPNGEGAGGVSGGFAPSELGSDDIPGVSGGGDAGVVGGSVTHETLNSIFESGEGMESVWESWGQGSTDATATILNNMTAIMSSTKTSSDFIKNSSQSAFAAMTKAANLYGTAYQVMQNENMNFAQKFGVIAIQAAGNAAITALTTNMSETTGQVTSDTPAIFAKLWKQLGWGAIPVFALFTGALGGLMGLATSAITKSKSQIAAVTGVSSGAGRISTGMLTYAEGNVNEFTDPSSLTPGRSYNVDGADGKTYRAKYTGTDPKTHITSGPEFHLVGEAGQEAIIDAKTTRQIRMNDTGIWQAIQTLYNGGRLSSSQRRRIRRGVPAFADGNIDEFSEMADDGVMTTGSGMGAEQMAAFQQSLDRNNELLDRALSEGIHAHFDVYGEGGLVDSYDRGKKTVSSHGEPY